MTDTQIFKFIAKIKSYYQEFNLDDEALKEWKEKLRHYDETDVYKQFEKHLQNNSTYPPRLQYITNYIDTIEVKDSKRSGLCSCNLCKRFMTLPEYERHYNKCLLITTLQRVFYREYDRYVAYADLDIYDYETLLEKFGDKI